MFAAGVLSLLFGALLGCRFKVWVLAPASFAGAGCYALLLHSGSVNFQITRIIGMVFLLQLGYMLALVAATLRHHPASLRTQPRRRD